MKRAGLVFLLVVCVAALGLLLLSGEPRRPRPPGWRDPWAGLALEREGEWALDALKRGVVQGSFYGSTEGLTECLQRYGGPAGEVVMLELLVETEQRGTHFEYVDAQPHADLPEGLVGCVTGTLERALPLPTPGVAEGTRWRLEVHFLIPPLAELPKAPWWRRFIPRRSAGIDVG